MEQKVKNEKRYETILRAILPVDATEWTVAHRNLLALAISIDATVLRLEKNARFLADKFQKYAEHLSRGREADDPTWHSTPRDITRDAALLYALKSSLRTLIFHVLGQDARDDFDDKILQTITYVGDV